MSDPVQARLDRFLRWPEFTGAALSLGQIDGTRTAHYGAGDLTPDRTYFAASTTKLYLTALTLILEAEGQLALDAPFRRYLERPETEALHCRGAHDRTGEITVRQLMQHTSGLPDYFESARPKTGLLAELTAGSDRGWSFAEAMEIARRLGPVAAPGDLRRARYSDTNYQILGKLIEALEAETLARVLHRRLFEPLGLEQTYLYCDPADRGPRGLRFGPADLDLPYAMASFQGDGGLVTTSREALAFVTAFYGGRFFDPARLGPLMDWRPAFFPLSYGTGMMRFALPRLMTMFSRMPPLIGHSGLSGAFLFHAPETGLCLAGTVNQIARRAAPFRLMAQVALMRRG